MADSTNPEIQGYRHPSDPSRRRGQGHRPRQVRRRLRLPRDAARQSAAQPACACADQVDQHRQRRSSCRACKAIVTADDLAPLPESKTEAVGEAAMNPRYLSLQHSGPRQGAVRRPRSRGRRRDQPAYRGGGAAADRGRVRSAAAGDDGRARDGARRADPDSRLAQSGVGRQAHQRRDRICRSRSGDPDAGFKSADFIVEREFHTAMVHQGYIEPHNAVGIYNSDGHATIYCSTQGSFDVRSMSAKVLGMEVGKLKVVPAEIGGGFGGKTTIYLEPLSVLLSQKTGHPVKLVMSRSEVLRASGPTSGSTIRVKMGATRDGKIVAAKVWMAYEAGAFPGSPVTAGAMTILAPYVIENVQIDAYDVVRQPAQDRRLPGARRDQRRVCRRDRDRRARRKMRDRSARDADQERRARRHAASVRPALQANRLRRDLRGDQEQRPLQVEADRGQSRPRRCGGLLVQRGDAVVGDREYPYRRHRQRRDRLAGYRRQPRLDGDDRCGGAGTRRSRTFVRWSPTPTRSAIPT